MQRVLKNTRLLSPLPEPHRTRLKHGKISKFGSNDFNWKASRPHLWYFFVVDMRTSGTPGTGARWMEALIKHFLMRSLCPRNHQQGQCGNLELAESYGSRNICQIAGEIEKDPKIPCRIVGGFAESCTKLRTGMENHSSPCRTSALFSDHQPMARRPGSAQQKLLLDR